MVWGKAEKGKKTMKNKTRNRLPFKANDPAVFETLASVILGRRINTTTPHNNAMPKEIKDLLRKIK